MCVCVPHTHIYESYVFVNALTFCTLILLGAVGVNGTRTAELATMELLILGCQVSERCWLRHAGIGASDAETSSMLLCDYTICNTDISAKFDQKITVFLYNCG